MGLLLLFKYTGCVELGGSGGRFFPDLVGDEKYIGKQMSELLTSCS